MIEKMKVLHIVSEASRKTELLDQLRDLGVVHFAEKKSADKACLDRFAALSKTALALKDYAPKEFAKDTLPDAEFEELFTKTAEAIELKKSLSSAKGSAISAADKIRSWGDFSPAEVVELREQGYNLHFYRLDKKTIEALAADEEYKFFKGLKIFNKIMSLSTGEYELNVRSSSCGQ